VLTAAAVATPLTAAHLSSAQDGQPRGLRPNLDQEVPRNLDLFVDGPKLRLSFRSTTRNGGPGPLIVDGRQAGDGKMRAVQRVRQSNGGRRTMKRRLGLIYFEQWRFKPAVRFELRRESDFKLVRPAKLVGLCLRDSFDADEDFRHPREPRRRVFENRCGTGRDGLDTVHEGLSSGWAVRIPTEARRGTFDVTRLKTGRYWLVQRVDPGKRIAESNERDNAASVLLDVQATELDDGTRRASISTVRFCRESARCSD
jgi:hypothetical protein